MSLFHKRYAKYLCSFIAVYVCLAIAVSIFGGGNELTFAESRKLLLLSLIILLHSFIYNSQKLYFISIFILGIFSLSILSIKLFTGEHLLLDEIKRYLYFSLIILNIYIFITAAISRYRIGIFASLLLFIAMFIPIITVWNYYFISNTFFNTAALLAVLQTNIAETQEYLQMNASATHYIASGIIAILLFSTFICTKKIKFKASKKLNALAVVLLLIDVFMLPKYYENTLTNIFLGTNQYLKQYQKFTQQKDARMTNMYDNLNITSADTPGVYVLVIGESQNKQHMSAYGYTRDTTPWLKSMQNNANFTLFNNAFSCHTHTVPALTYALTAKNQYNDLALEHAPSIIEVAKAAGFETVWLSNQVQYSAWDTPVTIIASEAQQQDWLNQNVGEQTRTNYYDLKLTDSLAKLKMSDKMLIIIHLMGNHGSYAERYPKDFSQYQPENSINAYDNSILYNDFVMQHIYQTVQTLPNFKGLIYFADHSEGVDQNLSHDASTFVPEMTYIPFYIYLANDYLQTNPDVLTNLKAHQNDYFTNDLIFNTTLSIMGIKITNLYEPQNDITSTSYDSTQSRFKTLYGEKSIL